MLDALLALIKGKGWRVREFERRLGVTTGTVNGWIKRNAIPEKQLPKVASLLNTTEAYLRGETDDPRSEVDQEVDELELEMLGGFRGLSEEQKRALIAMANTMNRK